MTDKYIIQWNCAWECENMDNLAPIIWEGYELLLNDGSHKLISDIEQQNYRHATEQEYKDFYRAQGHLFPGDEVIIVKGRKIPIGSHKYIEEIKELCVPNTYGKITYKKVVFTDGTYTYLENIKSVIAPDRDAVEHFKFNIGGRK